MGLFNRDKSAASDIIVAPMRVEAQQMREQRDPRAGSLSTQYVSPGQPMIQEWDAESAVKWAYIANTYVYRCVDAISTAIATCPFRAVSPTDDSRSIPTAPLAQLLGPPPGGPNPALSPRRIWKWTVAQRLITGRWCWEKERLTQEATEGRVLGLWPLAAHLIQPVPSNGGRKYFDEFIYNRGSGYSREQRFTPTQVVYDWNPSQSDFRQAESVLQAARLDISVAVMQDRYDVAFLKNDARPAAVIVHEEFAEREEREAFRQQFLADYRGVDNAGRPIFIEATPGEEEINRTFHIERLGLSQKDAEFIARYETKIRAICVAFGTPMSILGDSSARSFDNAGQEYRNWWEGTLLPIMAEFEDAVNMQLAPDLGREIGKFETKNVAALMRNSKILSLGGAIPQFVAGGIIKENEVRAELDLEELSDAELEEMKPPEPPALPAGPPRETDQKAPVEETGRALPTGRTKDNNEDVNLSRIKRMSEFEVRDRVRLIETLDGHMHLEVLPREERVGNGSNQYQRKGGAGTSYTPKSPPIATGSTAGITTGVGSGTGSWDDPGDLPAGVKPTIAGVRADVRKTVESAGLANEKKDHFTPVMVPGTKYSSGSTRTVSGTKVRVSPEKDGKATVRIDDVKNAKGVVTALRARGYQVDDKAAGFDSVQFRIKGRTD